MSVAYFNGKALTGPMGPQGPDGNPIGSIISYLGSTAPEGYLVCDGAEYPIADYSQLAAFFEKEFGRKNHFGGDGTSTFAVPDFRNLFLRGFHGESEEKLSGGIGAKQEGTEHYNIVPTNDGWRAPRRFSVNESESPVPNADKMIGGLVSASATAMSNTGTKVYDSYTSRPVNAAVQYCIKATKSFEEDPPQGDISVGVFYNSKTAKVVVPASGWSANAPFTNTVAVADVIANPDMQNIMVTPIEQHLNLQAKFGVIATSQGKASLTFSATTKPDVDIIYYVFVVGSEPVQDDIVAWSPRMTSAITPKPYSFVVVGYNPSNPWYMMDDSDSTSLSIANKEAVTYTLYKSDASGMGVVPFVVYGVEFVVQNRDAQNVHLQTMDIYGSLSKDDISYVLIKSVDMTNVNATSVGINNTYRVLFDRAVKYGAYRFTNLLTNNPDSSVGVREMRFLRSKADIIAEGGTI